jgi:sulfatase maturation enzyme AslB (radical SAM superfamily)
MIAGMKRQNKMASRNFEQTSYDLIVIWRVLDHCNLQCPFCEFSRDLQFSRTQTDSKDVIRFARVLGEYSRQTNQKLMVSWMGGEPFLWKDIFAVSEQLKQEHGLHISVTTNGTFLSNRDFTEQICRLFDELTVSIDGYGSLHDRIRRSDGLFEGILEGLRHMNELRATTSSPLKTIRVNSIMTSASIRGSEFFCHQLAAAGVDEISFNQLIADKSSELYTQLGLKFSLSINLAELAHAVLSLHRQEPTSLM